MRVRATRRAIYLLCARRRTFFFLFFFTLSCFALIVNGKCVKQEAEEQMNILVEN